MWHTVKLYDDSTLPIKNTKVILDCYDYKGPATMGYENEVPIWYKLGNSIGWNSAQVENNDKWQYPQS